MVCAVFAAELSDLRATKVARDTAATPIPIHAQLSSTNAASVSAGPGKLKSAVLFAGLAGLLTSCGADDWLSAVAGAAFEPPGDDKGDGRGEPKQLCTSDDLSTVSDVTADNAGVGRGLRIAELVID